MSFSFSK
jgi:ABA/WDS induced protein